MQQAYLPDDLLWDVYAWFASDLLAKRSTRIWWSKVVRRSGWRIVQCFVDCTVAYGVLSGASCCCFYWLRCWCCMRHRIGRCRRIRLFALAHRGVFCVCSCARLQIAGRLSFDSLGVTRTAALTGQVLHRRRTGSNRRDTSWCVTGTLTVVYAGEQS